MRGSRGFTLIEMVVAITIVAICVGTVLGVITKIAFNSADAMMQQQAVTIAQAYLDEIQQRWVVDPNGTQSNTGRGSWDLLSEYNGLTDVGAHDQFGNAIASLSAYTVTVNVVASSALNGLAGSTACAGGSNSGVTCRIDVTVTAAPDVSVQLSGYRTNY